MCACDCVWGNSVEFELSSLSLFLMGALFSSSPSNPPDMSGPVASFVRESIAKDVVVIFSKSYCPYCTMAKKEFEKLGRKFLAIEIENRSDMDEIQDVLGQMTGARSVPRVFVNGNFIGGGTDVQRLAGNGELQKMLAS